MSENPPSPSTPRAQSAVEITPAVLDLSVAMQLVETALATAGVAATERERMACAKTLLRVAPGPSRPEPGASISAGAENFAQVLRELGRG